MNFITAIKTVLFKKYATLMAEQAGVSFGFSN